MFTYSKSCKDEECFSKALLNCEKTSYVKDSDETVMLYRILGETNGKCEVNVKLLQIKRGSADLAVLENKDMTCLLPLGVYMSPEQNIKECHGILKEAIQELMIARMHAQLIENIGEIGEEATKIL
jgi:hypothetical protein